MMLYSAEDQLKDFVKHLKAGQSELEELIKKKTIMFKGLQKHLTEDDIGLVYRITRNLESEIGHLDMALICRKSAHTHAKKALELMKKK